MLKENHISVTGLRSFNAAKLIRFSKEDVVQVIHKGAKPISVMIPYALYMKCQEMLVGNPND